MTQPVLLGRAFERTEGFSWGGGKIDGRQGPGRHLAFASCPWCLEGNALLLKNQIWLRGF